MHVTLLISITFISNSPNSICSLANFQKNLIQYHVLNVSYKFNHRSAYFLFLIILFHEQLLWLDPSKLCWTLLQKNGGISSTFNVFPKKHFEIDENKQKQFQIITKSNLHQQTRFQYNLKGSRFNLRLIDCICKFRVNKKVQFRIGATDQTNSFFF